MKLMRQIVTSILAVIYLCILCDKAEADTSVNPVNTIATTNDDTTTSASTLLNTAQTTISLNMTSSNTTRSNGVTHYHPHIASLCSLGILGSIFSTYLITLDHWTRLNYVWLSFHTAFCYVLLIVMLLYLCKDYAFIYLLSNITLKTNKTILDFISIIKCILCSDRLYQHWICIFICIDTHTYIHFVSVQNVVIKKTSLQRFYSD